MSLNKKTFLPALYLFLHSLVITVPIFAYASDSPEAVGTLTADRLWATTAAVLGLAGVIIGGLALARAGRPGGNGGGKRRSVVALVIALIATVNGALVLYRKRNYRRCSGFRARFGRYCPRLASPGPLATHGPARRGRGFGLKDYTLKRKSTISPSCII